MRRWTAAADVRRRAAMPLVRYGDDSTALPAALPMVPAPAPYTATKARVGSWPRVLGLALGVWSLSYLARQALTWGSADMPFSPLGSFALEGIVLAVVAFGGVLGWSLVALAALRDSEQATPAAPDHYVVHVEYAVLDQYYGSARASGRVWNPASLPVPVRKGRSGWLPVRRAASSRGDRIAA